MIRDFSHMDKATKIEFVARAIRRDKGQLRADVSIRYKGRELDRDEFRFSDRTKRNALANSAFESLAGATSLPGKKQEMQLLLRTFNELVEAQWLESIKIQDIAGLAEPVSPPWVVYGYATEGAGSLVVGVPGAGKSWAGMLMAQSVQYAISTVYSVYEPMPVLYVNLERSQLSLQNRLGLVNRVLELDPTTTMPQLNARGRSMQEVREAVRRHIETHETKFLVLDSLSRMGMGSMSDDDVASAMMDELNSYGVTWVALGHQPRPQPGPAGRRAAEHVFGSQMLTAAADFEIILKAKEFQDRSLIGFKVIKANDAPKVALAGWHYRFGAAGLEAVIPVMDLSPDAFEEDS